MNILDRIDELKKSRGWSEYQLSLESGLTQSTISSWYRKNMTPSISSLEQICKAFGLSLSQFFVEESEESIALSEQQKRLLSYAARLTPEQYDALIHFLKSL